MLLYNMMSGCGACLHHVDGEQRRKDHSHVCHRYCLVPRPSWGRSRRREQDEPTPLASAPVRADATGSDPAGAAGRR
jgi:hypothetical protein